MPPLPLFHYGKKKKLLHFSLKTLQGYLKNISYTADLVFRKSRIFWKSDTFEAQIGPFWPKSPKTRFFVKKFDFATFQGRQHLNFIQKIRKLQPVDPQRNSRQTSKQGTIHLVCTQNFPKNLHFLSPDSHT